jgi:uncharacterized protein (DUF1501 family)
MKESINLSRRDFLRKASLLSAAGSFSAPFALNLFTMNVAAASTLTADYKALVCLFLAGGNDHNNMVIATDTPSWNGYLAARNIGGSSGIALPQASLLPLNPLTPKIDSVGTRSFALHPSMAPMQTLFNSGRAAIVANVGTLITPIADKVDYRNNDYKHPVNLFSHSDQTTQWHSTDSAKKIYGWGGRMADQLKTSNSKQNFTCMSSSGNSVFLAGETLNQYQITSNGSAIPIGGLTNLFGTNTGSLQTVITTPTSSNLFEMEHAAVVQRAIAAQTDLNSVMTATASGALAVPAPSQYRNPNTGTLANNSLAAQLHTVARIIAGRNTLGAHRQVFYVTLNGFDTHDFQARSQADLLARLAHAAEYFDTVLKTLPDTNGGAAADLSSSVTLFTASDFGRTFTSNGDGTDHGWGAHHFVVGGAVKGQEIYGAFPMTAVTNTSTGTDNPLDVGSGNLIPQISVDQYAATLGKWFGLSPTEITAVFPNLANFPEQDLGFMF